MFVKIFAGILDSSIAAHTPLRRFFQDLLILADKAGNIIATKEAIATRLRVPLTEVEWGIDALMQPDENSGNPDNDGRRIEPVEGRGYGWKILNYEFYRGIRNTEEMRAANARRQAEFRARNALRNASNPIAEAKADTETPRDIVIADGDNGAVPVEKIVKLYHEKLPELPKTRKLTSARRAQIAQRWREDMTDLDDWALYFEKFIRPSDFLMGRVPPTNGHKQFIARLPWITKSENYAKIIEGDYANGQARKNR